ncbi:MAG: purine-nucleoside phosphorylase [Erysipelotrichaceae bacterium]|jgi:purine-nucleoside phosphorylase|nr:purine-nucleoside phosphorylase [Bacillota bacterium]HCY06213.1 purine-nucleoside phosphorylase [Erysipelotrichaceae bacterium]
MATAHNTAAKGDIAKTVLMPGDPLRAKFIAETFLEDVVQFNSVRNMFGFTGTYKGEKVSVMGSGMGMPSIGIYSYELYTVYDVENIIRIGSAGAYVEDLALYDVVLASASYSESSFAKTQNGYDKDIIYPSEKLNEKIKAAAKELNIPLTETLIHSSDIFYREGGKGYIDGLVEKGCTCVEMESFGLFHNANVLGKNAACLLTISDSLVLNQVTTPEERQTSFTKMMEIALNAAIAK